MSIVEDVMNQKYENHVLPFLWQKGESHEIIKDYLFKMKECDIHEVCIESRPHPEFCKEGWWKDLAFIIETCKALDMKIWLLDDSHFPTGYANGLIKEQYPELKNTVLTYRKFDIIGPQKRNCIQLHNPFDETEAFYGAIAIQGKDSVDLSDCRQDDTLVFDLGEGNWQVIVYFTSKQSGFRDEYINMVDKESCEVLIKAVYEPHYEHFHEAFGNTILGFFSDEPGFMNEKGTNADSLIGKKDMKLPWSDELETRLQAAFQQDYRKQLAALWLDLPNASVVRHTYMDIATSLYQECFDEQLGNWCRKHGVMHIGHVIEDKDSHARLGVGAGHFFRAMAGQDMAGVDIVINQLVPGMDEGMHHYGRGEWDMEFFTYALAKLGSSLAYLDPLKKGRCMAEVFGAFGWHEGLKEMKWIADHFLVRGVNYFVPHAFSQAEFPDVDCPPHFYAHGHNPQFRYFPALMKYMNQMSTLLSGGTPHPSVAILYHADAEWSGECMRIESVASHLTRNQIDFMFVPADVFHDKKYQTRLDEEGLFINGIQFSAFVLPYAQAIGRDVQTMLQKSNELNYPVYIIDQLPEYLYDDTSPIQDLSFVKVIALEQLSTILQQNHVIDIKCESYEPWLRHYHYTKETEDIRFFVNEHPKKAIHTSIKGLKGTLINMMTQECYAMDEVLDLLPYEAYVFVEAVLTKDIKKPLEYYQKLEGPWHISYAPSMQYPIFDEGNTYETLVPMDEQYPNCCGTFRYETCFMSKEESLVLEIEEAYETVEVWVDELSVGFAITPPYHFPLPALKKGKHQLRIEVTNTLDKEIHDMFSLSEASEPSGILGNVILNTYSKAI